MLSKIEHSVDQYIRIRKNIERCLDDAGRAERYLSKPPLKSTVLKAAFVTFSFIFFLRISLLNVTFFKFGKNLRLVLFLAWLTLLPVKGEIPVSSHLLDIIFPSAI